MPIDPQSTMYLDYLEDIAGEDVAGLNKAQKSYGNSWKQRGGVGAFMMLARKWDRIEKRLQEKGDLVSQYDIFEHLAADMRAEGLIDDIRDLRRYLLLVEAEGRAAGIDCAKSEHRDNK